MTAAVLANWRNPKIRKSINLSTSLINLGVAIRGNMKGEDLSLAPAERAPLTRKGKAGNLLSIASGGALVASQIEKFNDSNKDYSELTNERLGNELVNLGIALTVSTKAAFSKKALFSRKQQSGLARVLAGVAVVKLVYYAALVIDELLRRPEVKNLLDDIKFASKYSPLKLRKKLSREQAPVTAEEAALAAVQQLRPDLNEAEQRALAKEAKVVYTRPLA